METGSLCKEGVLVGAQTHSNGTRELTHLPFFRLKTIAQRSTFKLHQLVCLNIKVSFIANKSSKSEHRIQMYKVLWNFLSLTGTGPVTTTIQIDTPELHKAEIKTAPSSCVYIWSVCSRYFHLWAIILLPHLQVLLQIQQEVSLDISKWHNRSFSYFKVNIKQ